MCAKYTPESIMEQVGSCMVGSSIFPLLAVNTCVECNLLIYRDTVSDMDVEVVLFGSVEDVDKLNVYSASKYAMTECVKKFKNKPDYVLIHDGARPFIEAKTIEKTIEKVVKVGAVVVGAPAIDTIKICSEKGEIISTPKRERVFHAQTPQAFKYKEILKAHKELKGENYTDDSSMMEAMGYKVFIVETTHENKKITFKEDLV